MDEREVEAHNRAELWKDAINHLQIAKECLEHTQGVLDDLGWPEFSQNMAFVILAVNRRLQLAQDQCDKVMG